MSLNLTGQLNSTLLLQLNKFENSALVPREFHVKTGKLVFVHLSISVTKLYFSQ